MSYLLDTCILSKLRKVGRQRDLRLESWIRRHSENSYFISVLTLGEIQSGINKLKDEEKQKRLILEDWFINELIPRFQHRILDVDVEVALTWGNFSGEGKKRGVVIPLVDGLIAATAIVHNLTVVTENISDFTETGVRLFNPWLD